MQYRYYTRYFFLQSSCHYVGRLILLLFDTRKLIASTTTSDSMFKGGWELPISTLVVQSRYRNRGLNDEMLNCVVDRCVTVARSEIGPETRNVSSFRLLQDTSIIVSFLFAHIAAKEQLAHLCTCLPVCPPISVLMFVCPTCNRQLPPCFYRTPCVQLSS
ncbi:unnamed protein product [Sphacelaria rigidula]